MSRDAFALCQVGDPMPISAVPDRAATSLPSPVEAALREVFTQLEDRRPERHCKLRTGCCHFRQTGRQPLVTWTEALFAAKGVRASGRVKIQPHPSGACPMLSSDGRCVIYFYRPFGCRTHFCAAAGGPYPRKLVADFIQQLEALDEQIGWHDGSRTFEPALVDALAAMK